MKANYRRLYKKLSKSKHHVGRHGGRISYSLPEAIVTLTRTALYVYVYSAEVKMECREFARGMAGGGGVKIYISDTE
jgi:hypothetical protein